MEGLLLPMEIEALRLNSPCRTVAKGNALGRPARPHSLVLVQISHPVAHSTELRTLGLRPFLQDLSVCKEQFPSLSFLGSHLGVEGVHVHVHDAARLLPLARRGTFPAFTFHLAGAVGPAHRLGNAPMKGLLPTHLPSSLPRLYAHGQA